MQMDRLLAKEDATKKRSDNSFCCRLTADLLSVLSPLDRMAEARICQTLENYVGKFGYTLMKKNELTLEPKEIIALRSHIRTSTNGILRLAVFLRSIRDDLKCLFPTRLKTVIGNFERQARDIPHNVKLVPLITDKKGKKKDMCVFYYLLSPVLMGEQLIESCLQSGQFEESKSFSCLNAKYVFTYNGDGNSSTFTLAIRLANRIGGNRGSLCGILAQFENGSECYENLAISIFSGEYPVKSFIEGLLHDIYWCATIEFVNETTKMVICKSTIVETGETCYDTKYDMKILPESINEAETDLSMELSTTPVKISLDNGTSVCIQLVHSCDTKKKEYVGFLMIREDDGSLLLSRRWSNPVLADQYTLTKTRGIKQIVGFSANDTKQATILYGINGTSCTCTCLVCLRSKNKFHIKPEWLQRENGIDEKEIIPDAPKREGENSYLSLYNRYNDRTANGEIGMSAEEKRQVNEETGSTTKPPLVKCPANKESMSPMHAPQGFMNHFFKAIRGTIQELEKNSEWQSQMKEVKKNVSEELTGDADFLRCRKEQLSFHQQIKKMTVKLNNEKAKPLSQQNQPNIEAWQRLILSRQEERKLHATTSGHGHKQKVHDACTSFLELIPRKNQKAELNSYSTEQ